MERIRSALRSTAPAEGREGEGMNVFARILYTAKVMYRKDTDGVMIRIFYMALWVLRMKGWRAGTFRVRRPEGYCEIIIREAPLEPEEPPA